MTQTPLHFAKMHGLGNDFMVVHAPSQPINSERVAALANRHLGVGFDQLLVIEPSLNADYYCRIFNADGSEAEQCGNGLRCVARYVHEDLGAERSFSIETKAGVYPLEIKDYAHIKISMGAPELKQALIELQLPDLSSPLAISILSVGNPHAVTKVPSLMVEAAETLAANIAASSYFPEGANVGFMQVLDPHRVLLRTFERGAGETHACGSNACAAAVAGISNGWLQSPVEVTFRYGTLKIEWEGKNSPIHMTGPAELVFRGECVFTK